MMDQQQMAAKVKLEKKRRSVTNNAFIPLGFKVSQRLDMLFLSETDTFNWTQACWAKSAEHTCYIFIYLFLYNGGEKVEK